MAFIVEDGTGLSTSTSYIAVVDGDAYHAGSLYAAEWTAASSGTKQTALMMATRVIDASCQFRGFRKSLTQLLEWPRIRAKNDDYFGQMPGRISALFSNYFDENSIPVYLKRGTAQVALDLMRADRTLEPSQKGIQSMEVGSIRMVFKDTRFGEYPLPLSEEAQRQLVKIVHGFRFGKGQVRVRRGQ